MSEATRKKLALIELWNSLSRARGIRADPGKPHIRGCAGRLLILCEDKRERFEARAKKLLDQAWRSDSAKSLMALERAWDSLGEKSAKQQGAQPLGKYPGNASNAGAYEPWKPPTWMSDPPGDFSWARDWQPH